jgi:hypothetical protein
VRCLAAQLEIATRFQIEMRPCGLKLTHSRGSFLHQNFDRLRITQRCACGECISTVQRRRISGAKRGGNSSLGVGCGAVE